MTQINTLLYSTPTNQGQQIVEVQDRQKRSIKKACKKALWFLDSFGLDIISIVTSTNRTQETNTVDYTQSTSPVLPTTIK